MKKAYVKPYIAVESFQLDAAIAASCSSQGYIPIGKSENQCVHESGYFGLACDFDATGGNGIYGDDNDEFCYHGPIGATYVAS